MDCMGFFSAKTRVVESKTEQRLDSSDELLNCDD